MTFTNLQMQILKKLITLLAFVVVAGATAFAQDDELPPPSSKPKQNEQQNDGKPTPDPKNFKGFSKSKFDISKFLIEPIINLSISQYRIDAGFSPSIAYRVFQPKNANPRWGNTGLFVGGGVTYFYTQINEGRGKKYNFQTYGAGPLLQYNIWRGFFVRTKIELLGRRVPDANASTVTPVTGGYLYNFKYKQVFTPAWLIGAGYNLLQSKNIFIPVIVSYNMLHSVVSKDYSIYPRGFTVQLGFITLF